MKFLVLLGILAALFLDIGQVTLLSCLLCQLFYIFLFRCRIRCSLIALQINSLRPRLVLIRPRVGGGESNETFSNENVPFTTKTQIGRVMVY